MNFDRSRFMDRELLDPARVMEGSYSTTSSAVHNESSLDFLKNPVDLGVSDQPAPSPHPVCAPAFSLLAPIRQPARARAWPSHFTHTDINHGGRL